MRTFRLKLRHELLRFWSNSRVFLGLPNRGYIELIETNFDRTDRDCGTHIYIRFSQNTAQCRVKKLAEWLAEQIVKLRCRNSAGYYDAWVQAKSGGFISPQVRDALREGFVGPAFGFPGRPSQIPIDHLQGIVAQYLWYFTISQITTQEALVDIQPVGNRAIDHGGDGLTVHQIANGQLGFRLWEIKKATKSASVNSTITRACLQIDKRGMEYLAEFTAVAEQHRLNRPDLADLYGSLVDHWSARNPEASAGIAIATSTLNMPKRRLANLGNKLPRFHLPTRLWGVIHVLDDFEAFSTEVQSEIWKGL